LCGGGLMVVVVIGLGGSGKLYVMVCALVVVVSEGWWFMLYCEGWGICVGMGIVFDDLFDEVVDALRIGCLDGAVCCCFLWVLVDLLVE